MSHSTEDRTRRKQARDLTKIKKTRGGDLNADKRRVNKLNQYRFFFCTIICTSTWVNNVFTFATSGNLCMCCMRQKKTAIRLWFWLWWTQPRGPTNTYQTQSFEEKIWGRPTKHSLRHRPGVENSPQCLNQQRLEPAGARRWTEAAQWEASSASLDKHS